MSLYDIFAISDSEINVCRMPATQNMRTTKWEVGCLLLHHIRNVECSIRDLSKEFASRCFNKSVVMCDSARCEAFPHHTTTVLVSGIVISKGGDPRGPKPANERLGCQHLSRSTSGAVLTFPPQNVASNGPSSFGLAWTTIPLHPRVG